MQKKEWDEKYEHEMEMPCGMHHQPVPPCMMGMHPMHMHMMEQMQMMPGMQMPVMEQMQMMPGMQMPMLEQMQMMPGMQMPMMEQMEMLPGMQMPMMEQMKMMSGMQMPMMEQMKMMPGMQMPMMEQMQMMPGMHMPEMVAGEMHEEHVDYQQPHVPYLDELERDYPELSPEAKMALRQLMEVDFALVELNLYLDTHPNDARALAMHNHYVCTREPLARRVHALYGPLTHLEPIGYPWRWLNQPWPWRINF